MATTVDWITGEISIPKADLLLIQAGPPEIRQLDTDAFRLELKDLEDDVAGGRPWTRTHNHNLPVTISGVTYARTFEIIAPYFVTFEDGQYRVSLVGSNNNIPDVATVNQVGLLSNNSAGLTFSEQINDQSFIGKVWIDTIDGSSGTQFPRGTPTDPVSNFADAHTIAVARKFKEFHVVGDITPTVHLTKHVLIGYGEQLGHVTLNGIVDTTDCLFDHLTVTGTMTGPSTFEHCVVDIVSGFSGTVHRSGLIGSLEIDPLSTDVVRLYQCYSDISGVGRPTIDLNGADCPVSVRDYSGGLTLSNLNQGNDASFDLASATLELDATCTSGTVVVRGVGTLIDNSGVGVTVIKDGFVDALDVMLARDHARGANVQTQAP